MRTVSDEYLAQVQGSGRQFGVMVKVYGNSAEPDTLWLGDVISVDILRSCSDQLQIGACMSDMLTLETKATTLFNGRLKKVEVFYRCTAPVLDWIRLGTFYVDEAVTRNGVTAVKAYDMMSRLDKRVSWVDTSKATAPTFPCKMQAMLNYLCARAGVTTDFVCEDITVEKAPDGYTAQELISYIAASHGRNARFSPSEVLKFPDYEEVGKTVQHGRCYSLDIAGGSGYTVKGILLQRGGDDKIYIDGTASEYDETADGIVTAYDPFATVGIAEYAWNRLGGLNYSAVSLEMPAENILEPGDVFTVEDADGTQKKVIVMEQELSLTCTGGFVEKISCTAESKAQNRSTENRQEATEKQVAAGATSEKLHTKGTQYYAKTDSSGVSFGKGGDDGSEAKFAFISPGDSGDGFKLSSYGPYNIDVSGNGFSIVNAFHAVMNVSNSGSTFFEVFSSGETSRLKVDSGGKFHVHVSAITFVYGNYTYSFSRTADGWAIDCDAFQEGRRLEAKGDGLYYNGKRLLTEEDLIT